MSRAIDEYRQIRTTLCPDYLAGSHEIVGHAEARGCTAFPLGAGGGGSVLVFGADPDSLSEAREGLADTYREIPIEIRRTGHEFFNTHLPDG